MTDNFNRQRRLQKLKRQRIRRNAAIIFTILLTGTVTVLLAVYPWNGSVATGGIPTILPTLSSATAQDSPSASPTSTGIKKTYISPAPGVSSTPLCTPAADFNALVNAAGNTISSRFLVPEGWERVYTEPGSFAEYLRSLPLKPDGTKLLYWDGREHDIPAHAAVLDMKMPKKYEQCADTVIHIYSDYLYKTQQYDKLSFTFNNGFVCDFIHFTQGFRPNKDKSGWETGDDHWTGTDRRVYEVYLDYVFLYANTASLYKYNLSAVDYDDLSIGDMFIVPGFPGHVVIVADMIINKSSGEKRFITVQGSMPAVQAHVMMNAEEPLLSPWQSAEYYDGYFVSATYWGCPLDNIRRFR